MALEDARVTFLYNLAFHSLENKTILVFAIKKAHKRNNLNSNKDRNQPTAFREPDSQRVSVTCSLNKLALSAVHGSKYSSSQCLNNYNALLL